MGTKSRDWESIGNYVSQIEDEKLTYEGGAKRFGLDVSDIYEYNRRFKNDKPRSIVSLWEGCVRPKKNFLGHWRH